MNILDTKVPQKEILLELATIVLLAAMGRRFRVVELNRILILIFF
jgi:hypothetical protein